MTGHLPPGLEVVSDFCQHVENRLRCVTYRNHPGKHDLQPLSSVSVRAIERQEALDTRLAGKPITEEKLLTELDRVVEGGTPSTSTQNTVPTATAPAPEAAVPTTLTSSTASQTAAGPVENPA